MSQPSAFPPPPQAATSGGSPGPVVAAFLTAGAITTVMAFALGLVAHDSVITRLGQILVLEIIRLVSALLLGAAMALPFLIAKARGPLATADASTARIDPDGGRSGLLVTYPNDGSHDEATVDFEDFEDFEIGRVHG